MSEQPDDLRYPIGRFQFPEQVTPEQRERWIGDLEALPQRVRAAVRGLAPEQWETSYRPGGWTLRQLVHHLPDSHLQAYHRFKLALTEDRPTIRPYDEAAWAELPDTRDTPPEVSLALLEALHTRWTRLLRAMADEHFARTLVHPEHPHPPRLDQMLALYAWHGEHHLGHLTQARRRMEREAN